MTADADNPATNATAKSTLRNAMITRDPFLLSRCGVRYGLRTGASKRRRASMRCRLVDAAGNEESPRVLRRLHVRSRSETPNASLRYYVSNRKERCIAIREKRSEPRFVFMPVNIDVAPFLECVAEL